MMCQSSMTMRHNMQPAGCLSGSLRIAQNWEEASKTLDYSSYATSGIHFLSKEAGNVRLTKGDADVILSRSHDQRLTQILALYGWGQRMLPSSLLRYPRLFNFYRSSNSRDNLAVVQQSDDNGKKSKKTEIQEAKIRDRNADISVPKLSHCCHHHRRCSNQRNSSSRAQYRLWCQRREGTFSRFPMSACPLCLSIIYTTEHMDAYFY